LIFKINENTNAFPILSSIENPDTRRSCLQGFKKYNRQHPTHSCRSTVLAVNGGFQSRAVIRTGEPTGKCSAIADISARPMIFSNGSFMQCPRTGVVGKKLPIGLALSDVHLMTQQPFRKRGGSSGFKFVLLEAH
jgi:hypothetical protein